MRWKVYNPPLLPYDECIFMSSGTACSPCKCVGSLQHSQAKLRLYEVIKQVCSSLFPNLLQLFLNVFILIWLQILRYVLIGIIRRVGGIFHFTTVVRKHSRPLLDQPHLRFFPSALTIKAQIPSMRKLPLQMSFYVFI